MLTYVFSESKLKTVKAHLEQLKSFFFTFYVTTAEVFSSNARTKSGNGGYRQKPSIVN